MSCGMCWERKAPSLPTFIRFPSHLFPLLSSICIMAATHCSGNGNPKLTRGSLAGVHGLCLWVARAACASSRGHIVSTFRAPLSPSPPPPRPAPCNCSYSLPLVSGSCLHCRPFGSSCGASPPALKWTWTAPLGPTSRSVFHFNSSAINKSDCWANAAPGDSAALQCPLATVPRATCPVSAGLQTKETTKDSDSKAWSQVTNVQFTGKPSGYGELPNKLRTFSADLIKLKCMLRLIFNLS